MREANPGYADFGVVGGRTFDAETDLVVMPESLWKLAEGVSLQVRCLRGDE